MAKTKPTYRDTKPGVLPIKEIEIIITDNLANLRAHVLRNYKKLSINAGLAKNLHLKLAGSLFPEAGEYRKRDVRVGNYEPPPHFKIAEMMKDWERDFKERKKHVKNLGDHMEFLAWVMHRFLLIHPFFDYNGRIARLMGEVYLLKNKLPTISFMGIRRKEFAEAMKKATARNDLSGIIKIMKRNL